MRNFIFIWFLVSLAILAVVSAIGVVWTGPYFVLATWSFYGGDLVEYAAQSAVNAYEAGGVAGLDAFEHRAAPDGRMRGYFFDANLHEVRNREVSPTIVAIARDLRAGAPIRFKAEGPGVLAGTARKGASGQAYRVVISFPTRRGQAIPFHPWGWAARSAVVVLTAALLCSWLAWRLSNPLSKLRAAARRLASGDLTVRVGAQDFPRRPPEYGELAWDFDEMAHRIEALVNSQRQLLRDVSHELRTPLTRLGLAVNIARQSPGAQAAQALDRIDHESDRLNTLIERIIRLSRLEALDDPPRRDPIELSDFIDTIAGDANFEAEAHGCKVKTLRCEPYRMQGDRELLREALENVIRNAIRYSPKGTSIEVDAFVPPAAGYRITIRDHGPGVPSGHLASIFQSFHRAPQPDGEDPSGFGIGLAIAKRAVELHHGSIAGQNRPDGGFEVAIALPVSDRCIS